MRKWSFLPLLLVLAFVAACIPAPTTPAAPVPPDQPAAKPGGGTSASKQEEWDRVLRLARQEGTVYVAGTALGAAKDAVLTAFRGKYGINLDFIEGSGW